MKKILALVASLALAGAVHAGCGKTVENKGSLSGYDADSKTIVVKDADGKEAKLTLTPTSKITDKEGKEITIADLDGKNVVVVSEHNKVQSVKEAAAS